MNDANNTKSEKNPVLSSWLTLKNGIIAVIAAMAIITSIWTFGSDFVRARPHSLLHAAEKKATEQAIKSVADSSIKAFEAFESRQTAKHELFVQQQDYKHNFNRYNTIINTLMALEKTLADPSLNSNANLLDFKAKLLAQKKDLEKRLGLTPLSPTIGTNSGVNPAENGTGG